MYNYTIIGGGPSGIFCADKLSQLGYKVCLIESLEALGGCHRVRYVRDFNNNLISALSIIKIEETSGINNPLELNGVSEGDIILKINNLPATWVNLTTALKLTLPGDEIKFEIYGEDNNREVLVKTIASN